MDPKGIKDGTTAADICSLYQQQHHSCNDQRGLRLAREAGLPPDILHVHRREVHGGTAMAHRQLRAAGQAS